MSLVFLYCLLSNFVFFLSPPFPKNHMWSFSTEKFCLLFYTFYLLVAFSFLFFLQIKPLFIFQLCPRIHQKKFSHRRVYERPSSPAPGFNIKFNKAQRVSDLPKVINAGRARVRFAFSDSCPVVVLKHLIKLYNSEDEIMPF